MDRSNFTRLLDVAADLGDQLVDRRKQALTAQPSEEVDSQLLAVEIPLEVDEVGLDQHSAAGLELRSHPDVDRRGVAVGDTAVDALVGPDQALVGHEVGGGKAEVAATP